MKKILLTLIPSFLATIVYANTDKVEFPIGQENGSFYCITTDQSALISIDTASLNVKGACNGQPYVVRPGHLKNIPAYVISNNYFQIKKSAFKAGHVTVTSSVGQILCKKGHGDKQFSYGQGGFCSIQPE